LVIGYWLLVIGYWLLVIGYWLWIAMKLKLLAMTATVIAGEVRRSIHGIFRNDKTPQCCIMFSF
jgi:hypothetical protein